MIKALLGSGHDGIGIKHSKSKRSFESMNHCVPDWDASTGEVDATIPSSLSVLFSKPKWELQQHRKSNTSLDLAYVPDHEFCLRASSPDGGKTPMHPQYGKSAKHFPVHLNFISNSTQQIDNTSWTRTTRTTDSSRDGSLSSLVNSAVAEDPARSIVAEDTSEFSIDEDMLAYLYPLDNPLDRSYSIDTLSELPNTQLHFYKGSTELESSGDQLSSLSQNPDPVLLDKVVDDMTLGARRVAGFQSLSEETPAKSGCILPEPLAPKGSQVFQSIACKNSSLHRASVSSSVSSVSHSTVTAAPPMLPPRWQPIHSPASISPSTSDSSPMNFSYFSRPAALAKASIQTLSVCSFKATNQIQQPSTVINVEESVSIEAPMAESTAKSHIVCCNEIVVPSQGASPQQAAAGQPNAVSCSFSLPSPQEAVQMEADTTREKGSATDVKGKSFEMGSVTGSDVHGDKSSQSAAEGLEAVEPTSTTSLGCSRNTAERCKKGSLTKGKKKAREMDDPTECQSENAEDDFVELKKPIRGSSSKRSRAAEVHNLSERTDKASMLDEAIEYLKMLQLQLQMMSMRSGLSIPLVSSGMQHLQMPQMPHLPNMGMGMGMGVGLGMGMGMSMSMNMTDMGSGGSGRPLMLFPPVPGSPHVSTMPPTMGDIHERLTGPAVLDCYNRFVTGQQFQVPSQPISMDLYHAYVLQQRQQQHIHSQQIHDRLQPSNMTAGGPP
ncbi:hypothetical protein O6H91_14G058100 [Diphasiastrum complanatum]|uniref:Uncharacterized protein n=1 Tax=Diphasiastrum complanatum TaxID=34168 RepID=A0ACC2BPW0_DIPCM|nr:hypothetical protein O6H91_14G058100 [Diphasiastrum complanatum]